MKALYYLAFGEALLLGVVTAGYWIEHREFVRAEAEAAAYYASPAYQQLQTQLFVDALRRGESGPSLCRGPYLPR